MGLVIQIAFGIVLAWLIITRLDTIARILLAPFRFVGSVLYGIGGIFYEIFYGVIATIVKVLIYILPLAFVVGAVVGLFYCFFTFVPQPYSKNIFLVILWVGLLAAVATFLKDAYESYKEKSSKLWMYALTIAIFCVALLFSALVPYFLS